MVIALCVTVAILLGWNVYLHGNVGYQSYLIELLQNRAARMEDRMSREVGELTDRIASLEASRTAAAKLSAQEMLAVEARVTALEAQTPQESFRQAWLAAAPGLNDGDQND